MLAMGDIWKGLQLSQNPPCFGKASLPSSAFWNIIRKTRLEIRSKCEALLPEDGWLSGCCLWSWESLQCLTDLPVGNETKRMLFQKLHFYQLPVLAGRSPFGHGSWVGDRIGWATVEEKASEVWSTSVFVAPPLRPEGRNTVGNGEDWVWELPHPENWTDPSSWASSLSSEGKNIFTRVS